MGDVRVESDGGGQPVSALEKTSGVDSSNEKLFKQSYGSVFKSLENVGGGPSALSDPQPISMTGNFLQDAMDAATSMQNSIQSSYIQDANTASSVQTQSTNAATAFKAILDQDVSNESGKTGNALSEAQQQFTLDNTKFQEMQSEMQGLTQTSQQTASQESQNAQQQAQMYTNLISIVNTLSQAMGGLS
jgi:hypothetical protein